MQEALETQVQSLGREDPLKEETTTHSSVLAWKILWTGETDELHSEESQLSDRACTNLNFALQDDPIFI